MEFLVIQSIYGGVLKSIIIIAIICIYTVKQHLNILRMNEVIFSTCFVLLSLCEEKPPVIGGLPLQLPVMRCIDISLALCLNKACN